VDPATGRTVTKFRLAEPDMGTDAAQTPAGAADPGGVGGVLPRLPNTVQRAVSAVPGGGKLNWDLTVEVGRYHLQYLCVGPGEVIIQAMVGRNDPLRSASVKCDGSVPSMIFYVGSTQQLSISVLRPGGEAATVGMQLARGDRMALPSLPG